MNTSILKPLALAALFAMACGTADQAATDTAGDAAKEQSAKEPEPAAGDYTVELVNGETWEANPETTEGIRKMQALVNDYEAESLTGAELKEGLVADFKEIFAKCTMTGEAHEQLHNYLHPLKDLLDTLGETPTPEQLDALRVHLDSYDNYFH